MKKHLTLATYLIAGLTGLGQAEASTLNFSCIAATGNTANCAAAAQLFVDVNSSAQGVSFTFRNIVGIASSITDVYFDANKSSLSGSPLPIITDSDNNGSAVAFALSATPTNLPGANNVGFSASTASIFTADSANTAKGINTATEWLRMDYSLQTGKSLNDVLTELGDGRLRLGLHVRSFSDGLSASFVNNPIPPVLNTPIPAAAWLLGSGLIGLAGFARRKVTAKAA